MPLGIIARMHKVVLLDNAFNLLNLIFMKILF